MSTARRGLLAIVGGAAAAAPAFATAAPVAASDAALEAASARLLTSLAEYDGAYPTRQEVLEAIENEAIEILSGTPSTSAEGIAAKARAILRRGFHIGHDSEDVGAIARSLSRDVLAGDTWFLGALDSDCAARRERDAALLARLMASPARGGLREPECVSCGEFEGREHVGRFRVWHGEDPAKTALICDGCVEHAQSLLAGVAA